MYCPNCGKPLNGSSNYCPDCGYSIGAITNHQAAVSSQRPLKSKSEFISEHLKKSSYYSLVIFSVIFDSIALLLFILNFNKLEVIFSRYSSDSSKLEALIPFFVVIVFFIIGSVLIASAKKVSKKVQNEYNIYILTEPQEIRRNTSGRILGTNEWMCPKCGKIHQNYVGSCGCGGEKP